MHRLIADLSNGARSSAAIKKSYVWVFAHDNLSRVLAWKLIKGQINLEADAHNCYLSGYEKYESINTVSYFESALFRFASRVCVWCLCA